MRNMAQVVGSNQDEQANSTTAAAPTTTTPAAHSAEQPPPVCTEKDSERVVELLRKLRQQATHQNHRNDPGVTEQLALLERALDSELFKSVCQVYDQIYDTANITGSSELKASASAKATVAVFSASIGHTHPRTVDLQKSGGLGFSILSLDDRVGVFISHIKPGGVADKHGGLRVGDQMISINGINVEQATNQRVIELLNSARGLVTLVVKYTPNLMNAIQASNEAKQQQKQQSQQHQSHQ